MSKNRFVALIKTDMAKGILFIILSTLFFTLMNVFFKLAGDMPPTQKTVIRSIVMSSIMYVAMKRSGYSLKEVKKWPLLLLRSFLGTVGLLLNIYVLDHLILSDIGVISRLTTVFVVILSAVFLGERMKRVQIISVLIAFFGVVLVVKPSFSSEMIPYLVAILSALIAACAYTMVRYLGKTEKPSVIVFVFSSFALVLFGPYVALNWHPITGIQIVYMIFAGITASLAQITITLAYKFAPAREISIFEYLGVVFSGLFGVVLFSETIDLISALGYLIIFGSAYLVYVYNKKLHEKSMEAGEKIIIKKQNSSENKGSVSDDRKTERTHSLAHDFAEKLGWEGQTFSDVVAKIEEEENIVVNELDDLELPKLVKKFEDY